MNEEIMVIFEKATKLEMEIREMMKNFSDRDQDYILTTMAANFLHDVSDDVRIKFLEEYEEIRKGVQIACGEREQ